MSGVCIAAAGLVTLATQTFTLAWVHSIEKVRWEEDYRVEGKHLIAVGARIKGSGAGMEPPPGSILKNGWWHYVPALRQHNELRLTRSRFAADYELCIEGRCQSLAVLAPQAEGVTRIFPCPAPPQ